MAKDTTDVDVPVDHTGAKTFKQETANVSSAEYRDGGRVIFLTTTFAFDRDRLEKMTGYSGNREIAVWLQRQVPALEEMLYDHDSQANEVVMEYLQNYADYEREDEANATANPCGSCPDSRAASRLARGRNR